MDEGKAQQLVVLAGAVTIGSTVSGLILKPPAIQKKHEAEKKEVKEGKKKSTAKEASTHQAIVSGLLAMAGCSVIAMFAPEAGVGLAALVAGGAFFLYGLPVIEEYYSEGGKK